MVDLLGGYFSAELSKSYFMIKFILLSLSYFMCF